MSLSSTFAQLFKRAACFAPVADLDTALLKLRLDRMDETDVNAALALAILPHDLSCPRIAGLAELIRARQAGHTAPGDARMEPAHFLPNVAIRRQPQAA